MVKHGTVLGTYGNQIPGEMLSTIHPRSASLEPGKVMDEPDRPGVAYVC